jgi:hypothetical protein
MTASTKDTFQIYHEQFHSGYTETLQQETEVFNAASRNAIRLVTQNKLGDYEKQSFFTSISSLVSRRDISSLDDASDLDLVQSELASVKLNRILGPIKKTLDSLKKIGSSQAEMSFVLGQQIAKAVLVDMVNSGIRALVASMSQTTAIVHDYSGTGEITHTQLSVGKGKLGDAMNRILCWVMYSKVYSDLEQQALSDKITNVADGVINIGRLGALGIPVIIVDSAPLFVDGTPDKYYTLGLVEGAASVVESEERTIVTEGPITGKKNLFYRVQGEMAYNLGVKGYTYDYSSGGANPLDAAIATSSNWDKVASDDKDGPGVIILTQ